MINILHFVADGYREYNSSNYRVAVPATALHDSGKASVAIMSIGAWMSQTPEAKIACAKADVIVLQRVLVDRSVEHAKKWRALGKAIVIDFDDAYDLIRPDNAAYKFWHGGIVDATLEGGYSYEKVMEPHPMKQFTDGLQWVSAVVAPSRVLCKDWQRYAPAYYIPNYLDIKRYEGVKKFKNQKVTIGWGGSLSHIPSFTESGVLDALRRVFSERDDAEFLLVGDRRVMDELSIPKSKLKFCPYVKFNDWPNVLARYDIGIAPLGGMYDCRRSHLKVMEYIATETPFIATNSAVYAQFANAKSGRYIDQGELDKCDVPNPDGWYAAINDIIDNFQDYKSKAIDEAVIQRPHYDSNLNVDYIIDVYKEIVNL